MEQVSSSLILEFFYFCFKTKGNSIECSLNLPGNLKTLIGLFSETLLCWEWCLLFQRLNLRCTLYHWLLFTAFDTGTDKWYMCTSWFVFLSHIGDLFLLYDDQFIIHCFFRSLCSSIKSYRHKHCHSSCNEEDQNTTDRGWF